MGVAPDRTVSKPDPTEAVKEALTLAIKNLDDKITQRLSSMDRAVELAREEVKTAADQLARANAEALKFALKTATDSSEKLADSFKSDSKATNEKIDRLTERINIWTGRDHSTDARKQEHSTDRGYLIAVAAVLIALASLIFSVMRGHL